MPGSAHARHQSGTRIGNAGRARINYQCHRFASRKVRDHPLRGVLLVVLVHGQESGIAAILPKQRRAVARIFCGYPRDLLQDLDRPLADVAPMAERGRNYI